MAAEQQGNKTADIVAESLLDWGVEVIFGLPGDGINGFMEALRKRKDRIRFILVRHEESAAFMACAYAKYTGKLGACVAMSGPGAIHLLTGLYDANASKGGHGVCRQPCCVVCKGAAVRQKDRADPFPQPGA